MRAGDIWRAFWMRGVTDDGRPSRAKRRRQSSATTMVENVENSTSGDTAMSENELQGVNYTANEGTMPARNGRTLQLTDEELTSVGAIFRQEALEAAARCYTALRERHGNNPLGRRSERLFRTHFPSINIREIYFYLKKKAAAENKLLAEANKPPPDPEEVLLKEITVAVAQRVVEERERLKADQCYVRLPRGALPRLISEECNKRNAENLKDRVSFDTVLRRAARMTKARVASKSSSSNNNNSQVLSNIERPGSHGTHNSL